MPTALSQDSMETLHCPLCGHERIRMDRVDHDAGAYAIYLDFYCDACEKVARLRIDYIIQDNLFVTTARFGEKQAVGQSL